MISENKSQTLYSLTWSIIKDDNLVMASMFGLVGHRPNLFQDTWSDERATRCFSGGRAQLGVRTTKAVKKVGCSNLKQLIEDNKLIIEDYDCVNELSTFIIKGSSYAIADDGCNDDLVACMFMFGWATDQTYFKELTDNDIRMTMMKEQQDALEQDMAPFGFIVNGIDDPIDDEVDEYGTRWTTVVRDYNTNW